MGRKSLKSNSPAVKPTKAKASPAKKPVASKGEWSEAEKKKFLQAYKKHGDDWKKVAEVVGTRSLAQTKSYGQKHVEALKAEEDAKKAKGRGKKKKEPEPVADDEETEQEEEEEEEPPAKKSNAKKKAAEKPKKKGKDAEAASDEKEEPKAAAPAVVPQVVRPPAPVVPMVPNMGMMMNMMPNQAPQPPQQAPPVPSWCTDEDVLLPNSTEAIASRPANREYIKVLQANCVLYHSLPSNDQIWFLNNVFNFLTKARGRKVVHFNPWAGYRQMTETPVPLIAAELNLDTFKRAAFQFYPLWIVGETATEFLHRKVDGGWKRASLEDVKVILKGEGPKNLLVIPNTLDFDENYLKEEEGKEDKNEEAVMV